MNFIKYIIFISVFVLSKPSIAQFQFSGYVNEAYKNTKVYLSSVDDLSKCKLFLPENILMESPVDAMGKYAFEGDFLDEKNRIYQIYFDNCPSKENEVKHLRNQCEDSHLFLFIAHNTDTIHLPLNEFDQMLCSYEFSRSVSKALAQIDSVQEWIYNDLFFLKNDKQRKLKYQQHYTQLQTFAQQYDEPLAELYAHHLYANAQSLSRKYYVEDLPTATYYMDLLHRTEERYPKTSYYQYLYHELQRENYPLLRKEKWKIPGYVYVLGWLLLLSMVGNMILWQKLIKKAHLPKNPLELLSVQEQKVLELMQQNKTNKEIASDLFISHNTVKTHINNIYKKLGITSRQELNA